MIGAAGLKGPGMAAAIFRQRLTAVPKSTRSISSVRSLRLRVPGQGSQLTLASSAANWRKASLAAGPAAIRFKSSMPEPAPPPAHETTTSPTGIVESTDLSDFDLSTLPERIGYLKHDLGLDYGWGTSAATQWMIEHLHIWGGIALVGCHRAKMHNLKPVVNPLREDMMRELQSGNQVVGQQKRAEMQEIHKAHGVKWWKTMLPMLQIPLGFGIFRATRGMTSLPLPGLLDESFLWIKDLTVCDPYYILPMMTSAFMYFTFKKGGESGTMDILKGPGKAILYVLPAFSFVFMVWQPAALQLYFVTTGIFALAQSSVLHKRWFRETFNLTIPVVTPSGPVSSSRGPSTALTRLQERIAEEKRLLAESQNPPRKDEAPKSYTNVSAIDQFLDKSKKGLSNWQTEASKSIQSMKGQPTTNRDGSPIEPPRITEAQRRKAEEYERERQAADAFAREERNEARRQAHMKALAAEREKAKASWQKQREAVVNKQIRRK
ncbi:uncharacterized protein N7477_007711 [Penicillium maclennaniae]|uniref:uncharacterized protein n=1 Tax=Penicillium maclennaniae TaxID=1343394 RepID=UPI00253F7A39|nr:uncharacterized protein N7477_007711 [Penicillium maclennaniae]KAJ5665263.1 hypothetical protein N7477_007711 [Penicillium maclennaniae]